MKRFGSSNEGENKSRRCWGGREEEEVKNSESKSLAVEASGAKEARNREGRLTRALCTAAAHGWRTRQTPWRPKLVPKLCVGTASCPLCSSSARRLGVERSAGSPPCLLTHSRRRCGGGSAPVLPHSCPA